MKDNELSQARELVGASLQCQTNPPHRILVVDAWEALQIKALNLLITQQTSWKKLLTWTAFILLPTVTVWRMKMNRIIKSAKIINRFGNGWLIRKASGKHALVGGSDGDYTEAKEWVSLFAHDIVFSRSVKRQQQPGFCFGTRLTN